MQVTEIKKRIFGEESGHFETNKGVKQEDGTSPLIFCLTKSAPRENNWKGSRIGINMCNKF